MWFIIRFILALYIQKTKPTKSLLDWVHSNHRVMPWDLDANIHMNNVKYLKYLERGRVEQMIHTPWLQTMHARRVKALIANTEISYIKEMRPMQHFTVETRINGWDDRYVYIEQLFTHDGTIFTAALVRMALVSMRTGKRVTPTTELGDAFPDLAPPDLPASVTLLNQLIKAQRQETQTRLETRQTHTLIVQTQPQKEPSQDIIS
ncbi:acyl-CoA thioesterase [Ketobacter sp.]